MILWAGNRSLLENRPLPFIRQGGSMKQKAMTLQRPAVQRDDRHFSVRWFTDYPYRPEKLREVARATSSKPTPLSSATFLHTSGIHEGSDTSPRNCTGASVSRRRF